MDLLDILNAASQQSSDHDQDDNFRQVSGMLDAAETYPFRLRETTQTRDKDEDPNLLTIETNNTPPKHLLGNKINGVDFFFNCPDVVTTSYDDLIPPKCLLCQLKQQNPPPGANGRFFESLDIYKDDFHGARHFISLHQDTLAIAQQLTDDVLRTHYTHLPTDVSAQNVTADMLTQVMCNQHDLYWYTVPKTFISVQLVNGAKVTHVNPTMLNAQNSCVKNLCQLALTVDRLKRKRKRSENNK
ncbi:protein ORF61 [Lake sturgeon herpesvirus]|nr:protein ORF61 [Lake sturgeon herpesvirus]